MTDLLVRTDLVSSEFNFHTYFIKKISPICSDNRSVVITTIANLFGDYTVTKYYVENTIILL